MDILKEKEFWLAGCYSIILVFILLYLLTETIVKRKGSTQIFVCCVSLVFALLLTHVVLFTLISGGKMNDWQTAHLWIAATQCILGSTLLVIKKSNLSIKDKIAWWIVILPFVLSLIFFLNSIPITGID